MEAVVVFGPIEHHPHQRVSVLGLEDLPGVGQRDLLGFTATRRPRRSRRTVQPSKRRSNAVLTEGTVDADGAIARVIEPSIVGRQRHGVVLVPAHDGADTRTPVFE